MTGGVTIKPAMLSSCFELIAIVPPTEELMFFQHQMPRITLSCCET